MKFPDLFRGFPIVLALVSAILLSNCSTVTETAKDARFTAVFSKPVRTKCPMRLYRLNNGLGDATHHYLTAGYFPFSETDSGEIGTVPVNHPVQFTKLRRSTGMDGGREDLLGTSEFRGRSYPIIFWLGWPGDNTNAGWRGFYGIFVVPTPPASPAASPASANLVVTSDG